VKSIQTPSEAVDLSATAAFGVPAAISRVGIEASGAPLQVRSQSEAVAHEIDFV
jgi:hypothetical protein